MSICQNIWNRYTVPNRSTTTKKTKSSWKLWYLQMHWFLHVDNKSENKKQNLQFIISTDSRKRRPKTDQLAFGVCYHFLGFFFFFFFCTRLHCVVFFSFFFSNRFEIVRIYKWETILIVLLYGSVIKILFLQYMLGWWCRYSRTWTKTRRWFLFIFL